MTNLTLDDDWLTATKDLTTVELRELALAWCQQVEQTKWPADTSLLACAIERNSQFLRAVITNIKENDLTRFTKTRGCLMECLGFKQNALVRNTQLLWYGSNFERRRMLLNWANMNANTASTLLKPLVSCQNRFWDIAEAYPEDAEVKNAAIWLSLLTGLTSAPFTALPYKQLTMYRTIGLSLNHRADWDEVIVNDLVESLGYVGSREAKEVLPSLAKALKFVSASQLPMNGLRAVAKNKSTLFSVFDAMSMLLPKGKFNWEAAEALGLSFEEAVEAAQQQCEVAASVDLPNTMTV